MSQNSKFRLKYDELRSSDPTRSEKEKDGTSPESETRLHFTAANVRNLCFAWPNGRQKFFGYNYLVSGELSVEDDMNVVTLSFTSDIVTIKGYNLEQLFTQLSSHTPSLITQIDPRYAATSGESESVVIEIIVTPL